MPEVPFFYNGFETHAIDRTTRLRNKKLCWMIFFFHNPKTLERCVNGKASLILTDFVVGGGSMNWGKF